MKALSIVAPNGTRIAKGLKTIEVRSWLPEIEPGEDLVLVENDRYLTSDDDLDSNGRVVAIASVHSIRPYAISDMIPACATIWADGYYSWELSNVRPVLYSTPVPARKSLYSLELDETRLRIQSRPDPVFDDQFYSDRFRELLKRNELIPEVLKRSRSLGISQWAVGAGFVQQSVFNLFHGKPVMEGIKDIDWVYFDPSDLSEETEAKVIAKVHSAMKDIPVPFDVKNQARVHLWYRQKFGYDIAPYTNLENAISTWPTTSTAVALTERESGTEIIAPFGLSDLLNMIVRPNKRQITKDIYLAKVNRWKIHWPHLRVVEWEDA